MKIYDCFMFSDEKMILDIRLNVLNEYIDHFVIVESKYKHDGSVKGKNFDIEQFSKFKNKITYIYVDEEPKKLLNINISNDEDKKNKNLLHNTYLRENSQRNMINEGIHNALPDDLIIVGDIDEIPKLNNLKFNNLKNKILVFQQKMFYYKLNLFYKELVWNGSRACSKKRLKSPQWLRNMKNKKYPFWRFDTILSNKKYSNIEFVEDGGWHFTNIRKAEDLEKKLLGFLHHVDYENSGLKLDDLKIMMKEKRVMYNHSLDKKVDKWGKGEKLIKTELNEMPNYVKENLHKFKAWLDI